MNVEEWLDQPVPGFTRRRDSMSIPEIRKVREVWQACLDAQKAAPLIVGYQPVSSNGEPLPPPKKALREYV